MASRARRRDDETTGPVLGSADRLAELRERLADLDGELGRLERQRDALISRRETAEVASVPDAVAIWAVDDQLAGIDERIAALAAERRPVADRVRAHDRVADANRRRDDERRRKEAALRGYRLQLDIADLVERIVPLAEEVRRCRTEAVAELETAGTDRLMRDVVSPWRDVRAPRLRLHIEGLEAWLRSEGRR